MEEKIETTRSFSFFFFARSGRKAPEKTKKRNERCLSGAAPMVAMLKYRRRNPLADDAAKGVLIRVKLYFEAFNAQRDN